jgi:hypothetical protein
MFSLRDLVVGLLTLALTFVVAFAAGLAVLAALGCSTPAPKPTPGPITNTTTGSPCTDVGLTYCAKVEVCGGGSYADCAASIIAGCTKVNGITPEESLDCSLAILAEPCDGKVPDVCIGIAYEEPSPQPHGLSL